jgi:hypothetical protein
MNYYNLSELIPLRPWRASAQIILFSEMLKFSKIIYLKELFLVKENGKFKM